MKKIFTSLGLLFCMLTGWSQAVTRSWDFDNPVSGGKADGWTIFAYGNPSTNQGILSLTATRNAGYCNLNMVAPAGTSIVDPAGAKRFVIRVKNGTKDRIANFIWTTAAGDKKMEILMSTEDTDFKEYVIDLTHDLRWSGTISKLLIQLPIPINPHSDGLPIEIDYIRFTEELSAGQLPTMVSKTPAPFGVNLSGGEFSFNAPTSNWRYPRTQELDYLALKGFKLIRLPFLWERVQPTLNGPLDEESLSHLKNIVWAARTRGIWVLLDLHNYNRRKFVAADNTVTSVVIGAPEVPISTIEDFWKKMAQEFKGSENIYAYGIMNEPYGVPRETPWVNTAQAIINAIRTEDTQHTVMVGGDSYSSASSWLTYSDNLRKLKDPSNNLMFEAHSYFDSQSSGEYNLSYVGENANPQTGVNRVKPFVDWLKKYNLRGFMGEYGIPNNPNALADKVDAADNSSWNIVLNNALQHVSDNGVSGTLWSYGSSWGTNKLSVFPNADGSERPQMQVVQNHLFANALSTLSGITSPLVVSYKIGKPVVYKPTATNNPTGFTVTQLPSALTYNSSTQEIIGNMPVGTHTIKIRANNANGLGEEREVVFRGVELKIPGTLQAEEYDGGGEGIGYHDKTIGNSGNLLHRDEDVDFRRSGSSPNFIYSVTNTMPGEWLKYTTNVTQAAAYRVNFRYVTTTAGTKINFKVDDVLVAADVELPVTTDLNAWRNQIFEIPSLATGEHVFTLEVVSGTFDVDRMEFAVVLPAVTPANLTATAAGSAKVNVSWNASSNATSYKLERSENPSGTFTVVAENLTTTTFLDETVAPATTYYYRIKGVNVLGDGPASANVSVTTATYTIPAKVAGLAVSAKNGSVTLAWTAQIDVDAYVVKRSTTPAGPYTTITEVTNSPYTDATVANNTTYYYVVAAKNSLGEGENSDEQVATPSDTEYAYWSFDQIDETTGVIDSWGSYHGIFDPVTVFGSNANTSHVTFLAPENSKVNNSIRFRNRAGSYTKVANGLMSDVDDFTISVWYRHVAGINGARLFDFGSGDNLATNVDEASRKMMYLNLRNTASSNRIQFGIQNAGALQSVEGLYTFVVEQGTVFHHILITKAGDLVTLYIDGVQVGQKDGITIKPSDLGITTDNFIGRSRFAGSTKVDGVIDEFKIYKRAFTSAEVAMLHPNVLPVAFLDFSAQKQNNGVALNWSTATENNNSHFEVLRSLDGKTFDNIAHVKGAVQSTQVKKYQHIDYTAHSGVNYYQLKQTDLDGKSSVHPKVLAVAMGLNNQDDLRIYAASGKLNLQVSTTTAAGFNLSLADITGKVVAKFNDRVSPGHNDFKFNVGSLATGVYIATYQNGTERRSVKLIIK